MSPVLQAENIDISYNQNGSVKNLIRGFNLSLSPGYITALIGANGSGKSSLLRVLSGLQKPQGGKVSINNSALSDIPNRQRPRYLASLFSQYAKVDGLRADELVGMGRQPYTGIFGKMKKQDIEICQNAMQLTGIGHLAKNQVSTLSDGEFRKVMLAKMLAQNTPVMILDEPGTHLDLPSSIAFFKLLKSLAANNNKAIIFSTHDLTLAFKMADAIILLDQGKFDIGTPREIEISPLMCGFLKTNDIIIDNGNLIYNF